MIKIESRCDSGRFAAVCAAGVALLNPIVLLIRAGTQTVKPCLLSSFRGQLLSAMRTDLFDDPVGHVHGGDAANQRATCSA